MKPKPKRRRCRNCRRIRPQTYMMLDLYMTEWLCRSAKTCNEAWRNRS